MHYKISKRWWGGFIRFGVCLSPVNITFTQCLHEFAFKLNTVTRFSFLAIMAPNFCFVAWCPACMCECLSVARAVCRVWFSQTVIIYYLSWPVVVRCLSVYRPDYKTSVNLDGLFIHFGGYSSATITIGFYSLALKLGADSRSSNTICTDNGFMWTNLVLNFRFCSYASKLNP